MTEWLPDAGQLQAHRIGRKTEGHPRVIWFTTEDDADTVSALLVAQRFIRSGKTPHVVWHPDTGELIQVLPAGTKNLMYPGRKDASNAFLVAVVAKYSYPFTHLGCMNLQHILNFTTLELGVPREWPQGPPYAMGIATGPIAKPGHYGASQVDSRLQGPGAVDINRIMESR